MSLDPLIKAAFGSPPEGIDLPGNQVTENNASVIILLSIAAISIARYLVARVKYALSLSFNDYAIVVASVLVATTVGMGIASGSKEST
ncbi:hypothetical protein CMEL01_16371 [Colletotrichum melonis]|uniref:Uncharacterized protein n=1 Tax=Colletotrichum melonis TaxID=1209925 RepID=A0AAI9UE27_9PEZI|nr:hypothetical protein CMEL01_16371 [Colletotrichum melonis]